MFAQSQPIQMSRSLQLLTVLTINISVLLAVELAKANHQYLKDTTSRHQ